jgi:hypothetical protein
MDLQDQLKATRVSEDQPLNSGDGKKKLRNVFKDVTWGAGALAITFGVGAGIMAWITVQSELRRLEVQTISAGGDAGASAGSLAGLLLFGVLTFFFGLGALIALLRALGLHDKDAALGMPPGSIRAFMALILIMLFFLMAVFLYLDVARTGSDQRITNVNQKAYDQMLEAGQVVAASSFLVFDPENPDADPEVRWDVLVRSSRESSQVANDIARQLVTSLGTLIVAITAFYFGTNAVEAAKSGVEGAKDTKVG